MKQEEQLGKLFKAAREEEVHCSYEQMAQQFKQQAATTSTIQQLLSKIMHMNTLLFILVGGLLGSWWYFSPTPSAEIIETVTPIEALSLKEIQDTPLSSDLKEIEIEDRVPIQSLEKAQKVILPSTFSTENSIALPPSIDNSHSIIDTSKRIDLPTILTLKKENVTDSIRPESELIPPSIRQPTIFYQLITIDWQDDSKQILRTKQAIADAGLEVKRLHTNRRKKDIEKFTLHLAHSEGLDWKFTVADFKKIELRIIQDDQVGLRAFAYRFNENGDFSPLIYLNEKSSSKHKVASGTKGRHITRRKKQD